MKAIRIHEYGGPDVLRFEEVDTPQPGLGEALVQLEAIGLNYIDTYQRTGLYKSKLPFIPGMEGAGVIEALGPGQTQLRTGDRVAWAMVRGSYGEYAVVPTDKLVSVPPEVESRLAAAVTLQGLTAHYLTHSTYPLRPGHVILLHAAGNGAGQLVAQMAVRCGATVIGTAGNQEKARLAREAGCQHVILYTQVDFEPEVKRLTGGIGVDVVYDAVGAATFERGLNCLKPRGMMVLWGAASGPVPPMAPTDLMVKGSLYMTRPSLADYMREPGELDRRAADVYDMVRTGALTVRLGGEFPLDEAAAAHRQLENRDRIGKLLLVP